MLKDRVSRPRDFVDTLARVAGGGTVLYPYAVTAMIRLARERWSLDALTDR